MEAITYWLAAENAREHITRQLPSIDKIFGKRLGIGPRTPYCVQVGFNEWQIKNLLGLSEEIHIFVPADVRATWYLKSALGKLCSPFRAILFTGARRHSLTVSEDSGQVGDLRRSVLTRIEDIRATAQAPLKTISRAATRNVNNDTTNANLQESPNKEFTGNGQEISLNQNERKRSEFEGKKDTDDACGPPEKSPPDTKEGNLSEATTVSFDISSSIFLTTGSMECVQDVKVSGRFIMKRTPKSLSASPHHRVEFTDLVFNTMPPLGDVGYKQLYAMVVMDSNHKKARRKTVWPRGTPSFRDEGSLPVSLSLRVIEYDVEGRIEWGFQNDDPDLQWGGMDVYAQGVLPRVTFKYRRDEDTPDHVDTLVYSWWSMDLSSEANRSDWITQMKQQGQNQTPVYSNLFNVVCFKSPLKSPCSADYNANLTVKQNTVEWGVKQVADKQASSDSQTVNNRKKSGGSNIPIVGRLQQRAASLIDAMKSHRL